MSAVTTGEKKSAETNDKKKNKEWEDFGGTKE